GRRERDSADAGRPPPAVARAERGAAARHQGLERDAVLREAQPFELDAGASRGGEQPPLQPVALQAVVVEHGDELDAAAAAAGGDAVREAEAGDEVARREAAVARQPGDQHRRGLLAPPAAHDVPLRVADRAVAVAPAHESSPRETASARRSEDRRVRRSWSSPANTSAAASRREWTPRRRNAAARCDFTVLCEMCRRPAICPFVRPATLRPRIWRARCESAGGCTAERSSAGTESRPAATALTVGASVRARSRSNTSASAPAASSRPTSGRCPSGSATTIVAAGARR